MKNLIFTSAQNQITAANTSLGLGNIVRRYGNCINRTSTNSITVAKPGYYKVDVSAVVENATAGALTLNLNVTQNESQVNYGQASLIANAIETITIPAIIRVYSNAPSIIQVVPDTAGLTIENLAVTIMEV